MTSDTRPLQEILSPRQLEVLSLVAEGLENSEIGERLTITTASVQNHINAIYERLHLPSIHGSARRVLAARRYWGEPGVDPDLFQAALELCQAKRRLHQATAAHDQAAARWEQVSATPALPPLPKSCQPPDEDGYRVPQIARIVGVDRSTVHHWIRRGDLDAIVVPEFELQGHHATKRVPHNALLSFLWRTGRTTRYDLERVQVSA